MAENEKEDEEKNEEKKKKKGIKSTVILILTPFISIILAAACFIAIIQGILDVIVGVVNNIIDFISNPWEHIEGAYNDTINSINYVFDLPWYNRPRGTGCTIILNDSAVETIKENISNQAIDTNSTGLSDVLIKKMILVNYMTTCTVDTEIALPIEQEDLEELFDGHLNWDINLNSQEGIFMYWIGDGKGRGEENTFYMSVRGIVKLEDENGKEIVSYDQKTLDKLVSDYRDRFNAKKKNSLDTMRYDVEHSYMIETPGTIKLAKTKTIDTKTTYKYGTETLVEEEEEGIFQSEYISLNYSQYISQYAMPMDFLISLLELTGSDKFVEAVCDLVGESEIKVVVAANQSARIDYDATRYLDTVTVEGIQPVKVETEETLSINYYNVSVNEVVMDTLIPGETVNVMEEVQKNTKDTQYGIFVKEVNTWYCKAKYQISNDWQGSFISIDEGGNEVVQEREYNGQSYDLNSMTNEIEESKKSRIWIKQEEDERNEEWKCYSGEPKTIIETYDAAFDSVEVREQLFKSKNTSANVRNKAIFDANLLYNICQRKDFFKSENLNKDFTPPEGAEFMPARVTKLKQEIKGIEKSQFSLVGERQIGGNNTTTDYEDQTDKFLGLLKNDKGSYTKGANFKSDGKIVYYPDVYGGIIPPGELLVDGEEVLYQLMESSSSYNKGLENIMKYILKRYRGESVTSTDFDNAINWMNQANFSSIGGNSAEECLHKMMASYEGLVTTSDGSKYVLMDGALNDTKNGNPYHSISCSYGFMFYGQDYNGYDKGHEAAINQAYKDCGQNDMTLDKAIGDLINSDGSIKLNLVTDYKFPEKYAIPKDVLDRAHTIRLSAETSRIRKLLNEYNKRTGKNVKLTDEQVCAIVDSEWQYVADAFSAADFIEEYGKLGENPTEDQIDSVLNKFLPFYDPKYSPGRPQSRCKLFKEGIFTLQDGTTLTASYTSAGNIVESAKALVELTKMGGKEQVAYESARKSSKGYSSSTYVCASFVSETLYNATGLKNWSDGVDGIGKILYNDPNYELIYYNASPNATPSVVNFSESKNLNQNIEKLLQPGDIVATFVRGSYTFGHVVIYIGDNQYAHHGGGSGEYNYPNIGTGFFARYTNDNIKYVFRYKK